MKNGVYIRVDTMGTPAYLYTNIPDEPLNLEQREEVARTTVRQFAQLHTRFLAYALIRLRRGNRRFEEREGVFAFMSSVSLETARRNALAEMLGLGLDADPLFTKVASAESMQDVATAVAAAREQTTRRQELVA